MSSPATRRRAGSSSSAARGTTAATVSWPRACSARPAARSTSWPYGGWRRSRATPPRCSGGCPATRRSRSRPAGWTARTAIVDALLGTGDHGRAARAGRRCHRGDQRGRRAGDRRRRALRRRRLHRRGGRPGDPRRRHRHLPPRQARPLDPPRQGPRRRRRGDRHRHPVRRARRARDRPDPAGRARRDAAPHRGVDEVQLRQRVRDRRLVRPHGRAHDGRDGGDARRRGLRDGRRARLARGHVRRRGCWRRCWPACPSRTAR